jgi:hypothetical protein
MKKFTLLLLFFAGIMFSSCNLTSQPSVNTPKISNVIFTECNDDEVRNAMDINSPYVTVYFTSEGLHITHYGLEVNCGFDTVIVTQTLQNGVLTITETGEPQNAERCICHTDVSYTISNVSENSVNEIVVNGETVWIVNNCNAPLTSEFWVSVDNFDLGNLEFGKVYVVNTWDELQQHPYFAQEDVFINYPVRQNNDCVLITYFQGCQFCDVKSAFCNENGYNWNIAYYFNANIQCYRAESFMMYKVVPKVPENTTVSTHITNVPCTEEPTTNGNVLMLKVDYLTNAFEGGYEFSFENVPQSFNIRKDYKEPGDFGYIKLFYQETGDRLFHGTVIWLGEGQIYYPENLLPASDFEALITGDYVGAGSGFENIFPEYMPENSDYVEIWQNVQSLVKVREYLQANPEQKVKIFLYTPCVGVGNPEHWDWILFLKK